MPLIPYDCEVEMRRFLHDNGLAITTFGIFLLTWVGMAIVGFLEYNAQQGDFGQPLISCWS